MLRVTPQDVVVPSTFCGQSVLQRIAGGYLDAMRECIDQYGGLVWSLARRWSRTAADAEDATQEICRHIWRSADRFDDSKGSETVFITMISRRRLIDHLRKTMAEPIMESSPGVLESVAGPHDPGTSWETSIDAAQAMLALAELRPSHRQVLELGILRGLTQAEIARRLDLPLGTVKAWMRRGLMRVRPCMKNGNKRILAGNAAAVTIEKRPGLAASALGSSIRHRQM